MNPDDDFEDILLSRPMPEEQVRKLAKGKPRVYVGLGWEQYQAATDEIRELLRAAYTNAPDKAMWPANRVVEIPCQLLLTLITTAPTRGLPKLSNAVIMELQGKVYDDPATRKFVDDLIGASDAQPASE